MGTLTASLLALVSAGTWAIASHLIGRHQRELPPDERPTAAGMNTLRCLLGLVAFAGLWAVLGGERPDAAGWLGLAVTGALGFAIGDTLYFAALPRCGVQTAAMVGLLNVPIAAVLGWVWLGQALSLRALAAMGVVLCGVLLVLRDGGGEHQGARTRGVLFALAAAVCWSMATVGGHAMLQGVGVFVGAFARLAGALVAAVACAALLGLGRGTTPGRELGELVRPLRSRSLFLVLLPAALCASVVNLVPFHFALRELPGAVGALLFSTTPLFTLPMARLFREPVGGRALAGTLVGFAGVAGLIVETSRVAPPPTLEGTELERIEDARWPDVVPDGDGVALAWLSSEAPDQAWVRRHGGEPELVAEGDDWFVNWADFPQLAVTSDGGALTWLEKVGEGTYAYGVRMAFRGDEGWLHDDTSATEHGFVSLVPLQGGELFAAWLDGRGTAGGGPMTLRARVPGQPEVLLDERVCDCCQTDAALLEDGRVLVAWRDRSEQEVRDISWTVGSPEGPFAPPRALHEDGWTLEGCPVNGPAVAADRAGAAIAWFTLAGGEPRVQVAFLSGERFDAPVRLCEGKALGRVDAAWLGEHLVVAWLEERGLGAVWRARAVARDGELGPILDLGEVVGERADGFLRLAPTPDGLVLAYTDEGGLRVLRVAAAR